jgi:hypothetical protein
MDITGNIVDITRHHEAPLNTTKHRETSKHHRHHQTSSESLDTTRHRETSQDNTRSQTHETAHDHEISRHHETPWYTKHHMTHKKSRDIQKLARPHETSRGITRHNKTSQDITRHHDITTSRHHKISQDKTSQDITRHHKTSQDITRHRKTSQDITRRVLWSMSREFGDVSWCLLMSHDILRCSIMFRDLGSWCHVMSRDVLCCLGSQKITGHCETSRKLTRHHETSRGIREILKSHLCYFASSHF